MCRYITRPALANERVQCNAAGQGELKLKTPSRDITTHLATSPLGFVRLAALWCHVRTAAGDLKGVTLNDSSGAPNPATCSTATGRLRLSGARPTPYCKRIARSSCTSR